MYQNPAGRVTLLRLVT